MHTGSCLCGAVTFEIRGALPDPSACHCSNCRKFSGHNAASTDVANSALKINGEENLTWFDSSSKVRRGFCATCGYSMFLDPKFHDWIGVSMGAFDRPTGTNLKLHIFVADKGDYYGDNGRSPSKRSLDVAY